MNAGDKIKCSNNHTYTLNSISGHNAFLLIDENGNETNVYDHYGLEKCLPNNNGHLLCIQNGDKIDYTKIIEYIKGN
jgi:hypothetical protein